MKYTSKGPTHLFRLRAVVAYPAATLALVVAFALALTPFGPTQVMALDAPTPTATSSQTTTSTASPTTDTSPTTTPSTTPTTSETSTSPTTSETSASPTTSDPTSTSGPDLTPSPTPAPSPGAPDEATADVVAPSEVSIDHHVIARIEDSGSFQATYQPVDASVLEASPFQSYRLRFQLRNAGIDPVTATPQLEYRANGDEAFAVVPQTAQVKVPFYLTREWVPGPGGTVQGPLARDIAVADLKIVDGGTDVAVAGHHSMSANPDLPVTLPPTSYTEQEFTVRVSRDAQYLGGYEFRITDAGAELAATDVTSIRLGAAPPIKLSPGQRDGLVVSDPPAPTASATGVAYPLSTTSPAVAEATENAPTTVRFALASGSLSTATDPSTAPSTDPASSAAAAVASSGVHGPYSMTADQCAACHRGHTAQSPDLLTQTGGQSTLCFSCHDSTGVKNGTGAKDVKSQYTPDPLLPELTNNPVTREFYSHDAVTPAAAADAASTDPATTDPATTARPTLQCAGCHNSHKANGTDSTQTTSGWDASGRLAGVSGVSVTNGPAGTTPTRAPLNGVTDLVTREYQLCFKCHSGSALPSNDGLKPSQYALDKSVEFNPNNPSFHPVEAKGTNQSAKMADSLAGSSPYKLWNFNVGSTIRCQNCHAGGVTPDGATAAALPQPGSDLAPHTSRNRGILLENYKDRVLKSSADPYSAGDFALCLVCHTEAPFANRTDPADGSSNATNFALHGQHLTGLAGKGNAGTDIDTTGDGQGNATCAECHFRIHSTTDKVGAQAIPGSRLVNFAPNVQPAAGGGAISWAPVGTSGGSCTLTCHGYEHKALGY